MNCTICFKEEKASRPDGTITNPVKVHPEKKKRATGLVCSRCIAILYASGQRAIPWHGEISTDKFENMRRGKVVRLNRRS